MNDSGMDPAWPFEFLAAASARGLPATRIEIRKAA